jgi:hypothetical protein
MKWIEVNSAKKFEQMSSMLIQHMKGFRRGESLGPSGLRLLKNYLQYGFQLCKRFYLQVEAVHESTPVFLQRENEKLGMVNLAIFQVSFAIKGEASF